MGVDADAARVSQLTDEEKNSESQANAAGSADSAALTALESAKRKKEAAATEVTKTANEAKAKAHDAADVLAKQKTAETEATVAADSKTTFPAGTALDGDWQLFAMCAAKH